ncbi:MAG: DUF3291 domain-containing protein [Granulosicoccaceae bacterium]
MKYQLAQLNIAKFRVPQDDPVNADFVDSLDRINAIAESKPGFVWRFKGEGNDALDVQAFDDPHIAINLSVWAGLQALVDFVYFDHDHKQIMRRRKEWFERVDFQLVLWWIEEGRKPSVEEARMRLELLARLGPTYSAFTFKQAFAAPAGDVVSSFKF